jgi:probable F420-dependent oxidoreductase
VNPAIGRVGLWSGIGQLGALGAARLRSAARTIEALGFGALWVSESVGREVFAQSAILLAATDRIVVATGVANIWARDATAMMNGARTLAEAFPGRFVLGIGVSHGSVVADRGHAYGRPLDAMRRYLGAMSDATYRAPLPAEPPPVVLGALGPAMVALAASEAAGVHPYFVPVEHTAQVRRILGPDRLLAPEQAVVVEADPGRARAIARSHMARYLSLDHYVRNLGRFGWAGADLEDGGSDALVDALVAWGPPDRAVERVQAHLEAGADHVAIQVLGAEPGVVPLEEMGAVADALGLSAS